MTRIFLLGFILLLGMCSFAQDSQETFEQYRDRHRQEFNRYKNRRQQEFEEYRRKRNEEFAEYMRKAWVRIDPCPVIPKPKDEQIPPVVNPPIEEEQPLAPKPVPFEEVLPPPVPHLQPQPVDPIEEIKADPSPTPKPQLETTHDFVFFGTEEKVRFDGKNIIRIGALNENNIANAWLKLSEEAYTNLIYDCLKIRMDRNLSDWAYLTMLQQMSESIYGTDSNEAVLLTAFVYCQSGYRMRLGFDSSKLYMLFASDYVIYEWNYCAIDGQYFYALGNKSLSNFKISNIAYPKEQNLSLIVSKDQKFALNPTTESMHRSKRNNDLEVRVVANKNMLDFYSSYPTSTFGDNFLTRWSLYANAPIPSHIRDNVYPQIKKVINGDDQWTAVNKILNFIQTGFEYEYDNKVWGYDRAFFPEESLYYPYCDCEDRSILLTRIVRDLLGLKCILIFYPGHLAAAVEFTEGDPHGDYIEYNGSRFFIADGTIIGYGAPVGVTMKDMDNKTAKVILLE